MTREWFVRNSKKNGLVALVVLVLLSIGTSNGLANTGSRLKYNSMMIPELKSERAQSVIVETNRWKPNKCMWIVKKDEIRDSEINVIFPFAELYNAVCHILVGVSDTHICYIHLTPLTSFMRQDTSEVEKIISNLKGITAKNQKWSFKVYYFEDKGREQKFRNVIAKALVESPIEFTALTPKEYKGGELNLVLSSERFSYSVKESQMLTSMDVSLKGKFNTIPIEAVE